MFNAARLNAKKRRLAGLVSKLSALKFLVEGATELSGGLIASLTELPQQIAELEYDIEALTSNMRRPWRGRSSLNRRTTIYKFEDRKPGYDNYLLIAEDFSISYNPMITAPMGIMALSSDDGAPETALIRKGEYLILVGDFRAEFTEAANNGGLAACEAVFFANKDKISSWSDVK